VDGGDGDVEVEAGADYIEAGGGGHFARSRLLVRGLSRRPDGDAKRGGEEGVGRLANGSAG
jgi:hypothetical protein